MNPSEIGKEFERKVHSFLQSVGFDRVLSEIEIINEMTGFSPVLLLDDVMSELDISRKRYLLENIKTRQTIITGTEKRSYAAFANISSFYNVVNGTVEKK